MAVQMLDKVLVMKPRRSHLVKSTPVETAIDTTIDNVYGEPRADRFDEIIDLLKTKNIYVSTFSVKKHSPPLSGLYPYKCTQNSTSGYHYIELREFILMDGALTLISALRFVIIFVCS